MRLGTRLEYVESSPKVSGVCQNVAREFAGRRSRLDGRLSGVVKMLVESQEVGIGRVKEMTFPKILAVVLPMSDSCTVVA
ncbi:hypothetical protein BHM03_00033801 [Ensete ventricosum]|nr:hypothetical protein BHM03_00033801 [Ensete ventricosum]